MAEAKNHLWARFERVPTLDSRHVLVGLALVWLWAQGIEIAIAGLQNPFTVRFIKFHASVFCGIGVLLYFPSTQRFGLALLYWTFSLWITAHCLAFSWMRHPKQYVPLPDLGHKLIGDKWDEIHLFNALHLDAGLMPDIVLVSLITATVLFAMCQPTRWIIFRRWFSVHGTLMLFRCLTISCTSLPDAHPQCRDGGVNQSPFGDLPPHLGGGSSVNRVMLDPEYFIETTFRMLMPGNTTCGDMVFSGHTMLLMLFGLTFHTYHKRTKDFWSVNGVKTLVWGWCVIGLLAILATRLHYTIDVLLGMYLSLTVWSSYHRIANDVLLGREFSCVWLFDVAVIYPVIRFMESGKESNDSDGPMEGLTEMHSEEDSARLREAKDSTILLRTENKKLREENQLLRASLAGNTTS